MTKVHPAVAEVVESRRLGRLDASRHRFTVSRESALMRLREQARTRAEAEGEEWLWTLSVVRAANALSDRAVASLSVEVDPSDDSREVVTIDVVAPDSEDALANVDLGDVLAGALEADLGAPIDDALDDPGLRSRRFRAALGRGLNDSLAFTPLAVEVHTPKGSRRYEQREQVSEDRDPYGERRLPAHAAPARFVVRVIAPRPSLGGRLGRWVRGRSRTERVIAELWQRWRLDESEPEQSETDAIVLGPRTIAPAIPFGSHARFGPTTRLAGLPNASAKTLEGKSWLVRDGVRVLDLRPQLVEAGLSGEFTDGWILCPSLRLTADERSVVRDGNFELLLAWLHAYLSRRAHQGAEPGAEWMWPTSPFVHLSDGRTQLDPSTPGLRWANGEPVVPEAIVEAVDRGRELIYVWRHRAVAVPNHAKAKVLAPWPSELRLLREAFPDARLVPLAALGAGPRTVDPADLGRLRAHSLEPLVLARDRPLELGESASNAASDQALGGLRLSVEAYVHRPPSATQGFISILAYERKVAEFTEFTRVIAGLTLLCRVRPLEDTDDVQLDVVALRRNQRVLSAIADAARERALEHWEALLRHVVSHGRPWETPLIRSALVAMRPTTIELRYRNTDHGLRLSWRDSALLDVEVGEREAGPVTLRDALRQLRDPGVIVVAQASRTYSTLRSDDPRLRPWRSEPNQLQLLETVLGRAAVLTMPAVPEVYPLVKVDDEATLDQQRHLMRGPAKIAEDRTRAHQDRLARTRLLGDLLVARGLGVDSHGLEGVPLLERYDSRAVHPTRLVSLESALSERPRPALVPVGAVARSLPRPVLEVTPGVAALLAAVTPLGRVDSTSKPEAGDVQSHVGVGAANTPIRSARSLPPLLATPIVHALFIGRLEVAGDASSDGITLWSGGLRQRTVRLPEPLGRVRGRLVLTATGSRATRARLDGEVGRLARALIADAPRQRALQSPLGGARENLDHFIAYARQRVDEDDPFDLRGPLGAGEPEDRGKKIATLKAMSIAAAPLRPLPNRREALLAQVVTQSLAMRLALDTSMLSWKAAKIGRRRRDGAIGLSFGLRNAWIQRGLDEDRELDPIAHRRAALLAGAIVVAEFVHQAREEDDMPLSPEHLVVALWRLLNLK